MSNVISRVPTVLCLFGLLVALSPTSGRAQGGPTSAIDIPASDIAAVVAVESRIPDRQIRIVDMGSYNLAVGVIHRGATPMRDGPVGGIMHSLVTETYVVISGTGTLVTGGTITDPGDLAPTSEVVRILNGPSQSGSTDGGRSRTVAVGDVVIIPAGVFHGFSYIPDHITYLSVRPDPNKVLEAGYVNPAVQR
jgi:mannose-6-phosphate isomerase-like protein (cupin superfamily)